MGAPAIIAALAAKDDDEIRNALIGEGIGYIASAVDPLTFDPRSVTGVGGVTFQAVLWQERLWFRDETDVSEADEITVITLADGANYLTNDVRMPEAVLSRTLDTPPTEEDDPPVEYGDAYLVPAAANDEWADHEDDVAIWTARGWKYRPPAAGHLLYVRDELGYIHYSEADEWEAGIGAYAIDSGSVRPDALLIRSWAVENQTTTVPPATGPAGEQYIIGASATGAWSGHDKKLAWRPATDADFVVTSPFIGEKALDKGTGIDLRWSGTSWVSAGGSIIGHATPQFTAGTGSTSTGGGSPYTISSTAPTTSAQRRIDDVGIAYAAKKAGTKTLRLKWDADVSFSFVSGGGTGTNVIALFRGSETDAIAWCRIPITLIDSSDLHLSAEFFIDAADTTSKSYKFAVIGRGSGAAAVTADSFSRRTMSLDEYDS